MVRPSPSLCGVRGCIGGWIRKAHVPIEKTAVNPTDHQLAHPQVESLCSLRKSQQEVPFFSSQVLLIDISISIERFLYWKPDMRNPYPLLWYRQLELDNLSTVRSMLWWILSESHKRKTSQSVGRGVPERGPWQVWGGKRHWDSGGIASDLIERKSLMNRTQHHAAIITIVFWSININISLIMTNTSSVLFSTPSQSSLSTTRHSCWGFAFTSGSLSLPIFSIYWDQHGSTTKNYLLLLLSGHHLLESLQYRMEVLSA